MSEKAGVATNLRLVHSNGFRAHRVKFARHLHITASNVDKQKGIIDIKCQHTHGYVKVILIGAHCSQRSALT